MNGPKEPSPSGERISEVPTPTGCRQSSVQCCLYSTVHHHNKVPEAISLKSEKKIDINSQLCGSSP